MNIIALQCGCDAGYMKQFGGIIERPLSVLLLFVCGFSVYVFLSCDGADKSLARPGRK